MKIKILLGVAGLIIAFLAYVAFQPSSYQISRNILISASADKIFPYINNPKMMDQWNPWAELDPNTTMTYSGPDAGLDAKSSWEGGEKIGTGTATIIESIPNQLVRTKLEHLKPFAMTQEAVLSISPSGTQNLVTWSVDGHNNFIARIMCLFMNMDEMVGGTFEKGLAKLKEVVEK